MSFVSNIKFWNGLAIAAMIAMAGIFVFDRFVPKPSLKTRTEAKLRADSLAREQTAAFEAAYDQKRKMIDSRIWTQGNDAVGALVLDRATNMARKRRMNLTAFRPQKPDDQGELTRLVYVMTLEGPYPGLQAMVRELETPSNRLSVHLVQVASADEASDLVTGTIGVSAFAAKPKLKADAKEK
jgi:hypothetical protein